MKLVCECVSCVCVNSCVCVCVFSECVFLCEKLFAVYFSV